MWQTIEVKASSIEQFRNGDSLSRTIDDISGEAANAAEMKAAATGNEMIFLQVQLASELKKMEAVYANFQRSQHQLDKRIQLLEKAPDHATKEISQFKREIAHRDKHTMSKAVFASQGNIYGEDDREALLGVVAKAMKLAVNTRDPQKVGQYRGFDIQVETSPSGDRNQFQLEGCAATYHPNNLQYGSGDNFDINGFIQRIDNYVNKFEEKISFTAANADKKAEELKVARGSQGQTFPKMDMLEALRQDNRDVIKELRKSQGDQSYKSTWQPSSKDLKERATNPELGKTNPNPQPEKTNPNEVKNTDKVAWVQVGDRGSFPIFNDRHR